MKETIPIEQRQAQYCLNRKMSLTLVNSDSDVPQSSINLHLSILSCRKNIFKDRQTGSNVLIQIF